MYIYVKAVLREGAPNSQYKEVDVRQLRLSDLLKKYVDGYIHLEHSKVISPFFVPINDLRSMELPYGNNPFVTWLGQVATMALPTYDEEPKYETKLVHYADALLAGFNLKRVQPNTLESGANFPPHLLSDILVTKDGYNGDSLDGKFVTTVNGLLHNTGYVRAGFVAYGGARTLDMSRNTSIGLLSFEAIGRVKTVHLGEGRVLGGQLRSEIFLNLGESIVGKSVALSIGGYLHVSDPSYSIIDPERGIVRINTPLIDIQRRLMRTRTMIDLSELGLTAFDYSENALVRSEAQNNNILRKYLTLPQSFAMIIDVPHIYMKRNLLASLPISGYVESPYDPTQPLIDEYGHVLDYWKGGSGNQWSMLCDPRDVYRHEVYHTGDMDGQSFITDASQILGYEYPQYRMLEIGSQQHVNK